MRRGQDQSGKAWRGRVTRPDTSGQRVRFIRNFLTCGTDEVKELTRVLEPRRSLQRSAPLPPAGLDLEPKPVLKAAIEARTALATLAQAGQLLPNPNILIHAVPLLEAQASSEIENIVTTADELFKHVDSGGEITPPRRHCATAARCSRGSSRSGTGRSRL